MFRSRPNVVRSHWGSIAGSLALVVSLANLALGQAGSAGAGEAAANPPVMSTKADCKKLLQQGKDCAYLTPDSVKGPAIAANAVGSSELAANSVQSGDVANGAINSGKLANNSVDGNKVKPGSLGSSDIGKLGYDNISGVIPTFKGTITFDEVGVVNPQFIGAPADGTTLQSGRRGFDRTRQEGGDFTCVITPPVGTNVIPCVRVPEAGVYLLSMDVVWPSDMNGSRIAAVLLPDETHTFDSSTWRETAGGGGGVLASALPASSDGKQSQSFSRLVELEEGQELVLMVDHVDPLNPGSTLEVTAQLSLALQ